ncbi:MAG: NAD(P)-dependent oxidoreductase, partial [Bdellovibrionales bacterium]|nr:NAD(P)-dependent oxidoreductase [Bdellovibrionales bacterium]
MNADKIKSLPGPILILGASGFIGANLLRLLIEHRKDVIGTVGRLPAWRLDGLPPEVLYEGDLRVPSNQKDLLERIQPQTVFDFIAYGAYSFQENSGEIYETNFQRLIAWTDALQKLQNVRYIHSGSSSEYGDLASGPSEESFLAPNSHYSVSKGASSQLLYYLGKKKNFPCANVRIYSAYGPYEDSSRLIPLLVKKGLEATYPALVHPEISRDFIYVQDVCEAMIALALELKPDNYGESFNVGSGKKTSIGELAQVSKKIFSISHDPSFGSYESRKWDVQDWFARIEKIQSLTSWVPRTSLESGLARTAEWIRQLNSWQEYQANSKQYALDTRRSVSAIIACYKDAQAIPIMHQRLTA